VARLSTPSQTAGPFVSIGTEWDAAGRLAEEGSPAAITVTGTVFDGRGEPVSDAMLEFWQADPEGRFPPETAPTWTGFTRSLTDKDGHFRLVTVKPGCVPGPDGEPQGPHIAVSLFARGLLQRLVTRIYFSDEGARNAADPLLAGLADASLANRLVANRAAVGSVYELDIRLQGEEETIFFTPS
jgi:protocatechuate 3,4-dioxygenase, alpha subunit